MPSETPRVILSHFQAERLERGRAAGLAAVRISLDLGLSESEAGVEPGRAVFTPGAWLAWETVAEIRSQPNACFLVGSGQAEKIQRFSEQLQRHYSLMPTAGAPTLLIAGFPMHRIKDTDPHRDTLAKVRAAGPLRGRVLDTCTGLGYTAIEAARSAEQVISVELDPTTLEIAWYNPWSQALFSAPNIEQRLGDACEIVPGFPGGHFSRVIHDPPTFSLAGELYSSDFYLQLHRVLRRDGRLFHYIGDLDSRSGSQVARGVVRRLRAAGFVRIVPRPEAFGLLAFKG